MSHGPVYRDGAPNKFAKETADARWERISAMPGVVVHVNQNPQPWNPPSDIRVMNIENINQLTGDDWGDEVEDYDQK